MLLSFCIWPIVFTIIFFDFSCFYLSFNFRLWCECVNFELLQSLEIRSIKRVKSKKDGLDSKWTIQGGATGQSKRLKLDGPKDSKWTVQKAKTSRSKGMEMYGQERWNWTVKRSKTGRYQGMIVDDKKINGQLWVDRLKRWNWTVQR